MFRRVLRWAAAVLWVLSLGLAAITFHKLRDALIEARTERDEWAGAAYELANRLAESREELEEVRRGGRAILERQAEQIGELKKALANERKLHTIANHESRDLLPRY